MEFSDITLTTATVSWVVPYTPTWQQYSIEYGLQPDVLDLNWGLLHSPVDLTLTDQQYSITMRGLTQGTEYFIRISSTFEYNRIYSELTSFLTIEPRMYVHVYNIMYTLLVIYGVIMSHFPNSSHWSTTQLHH